MFDVFVCKAFAARALREPDPFSERAVVGFGVGGVEGFDGVAAFDADGHLGWFQSFQGWLHM